jgi:hypothetical protein
MICAPLARVINNTFEHTGINVKPTTNPVRINAGLILHIEGRRFTVFGISPNNENAMMLR